MTTNSYLNRINKELISDIAIFAATAIFSQLLIQDFEILITFLTFVIISSKYYSSISILQNISLAALLPIILSPVYLVARGFFTHSKLLSYDYIIYLTLFLILLKLLSSKPVIKNKIYLSENLSKIILSWASLIFLILLSIFLKAKSVGFSVAWIMSGDSRGHLVFANDIAKSGWLDASTFLLQPISAPSFLSMFLQENIGNSSDLSSALAGQLQTYLFVWIIFIAILGTLSAASAELIWKNIDKKNSDLPTWVFFLASTSALMSAIIGPATNDGFFTAVLSIATVLAMVNWILELNLKSQLPLSFISYGFTILIGSLLSWMFVAMFTFPLILIGFFSYILGKSKHKFRISNFAFLGALALALFMHSSPFVQNLIYKSKVALSDSGAISATKPNFYYGLISVVLLTGLLISFSEKTMSKSLLQIAVVNALSLVLFKQYSNLGLTRWNYYLLKYQWILASVLLLLVSSFTYVCLAKFLQSTEEKRFSLKNFAIVASCFLCFFFLSETANPSRNIWAKVLKGWENPRSSVIDEVLATDFNSRTPTLFFHHGYDGDSRLANFWLTSFLEQQEPIRGWNYTIDTLGDVKQMCDVNAYYNSVNIVTYDEQLPALLAQSCPEEEFLITINTKAK